MAADSGFGQHPTGLELIIRERATHQQLGWTPEHDDEHADGQLAQAAACYAMPEVCRLWGRPQEILIRLWPFDWRWWRPAPKDRIRELVKAGALIAAEIDRLQRRAKP